MTQFEKWALEKGGWDEKPEEVSWLGLEWDDQEKAFNAGIEAERERLRKLVEGEANFLGDETAKAKTIFKLILNWLTDPETDKKEI